MSHSSTPKSCRQRHPVKGTNECQIGGGGEGPSVAISRDVASPRCVMAQHLSSPSPSPSSADARTVSPIVALERYNRQMLRKATLSVVKSDYKEALCIGNEYLRQQLQDGWSGPLSYFQTTIKLSTPLMLPKDSSATTTQQTQSALFFQVRLGTQLTAVDEMAAIVLQAWHELARRDAKLNAVHHAWKHLLPLLEIYSKHPMPVQFFVQLWIPFWHSPVPSVLVVSSNNGDVGAAKSLALAWSLQVSVLLVEQSLRITEGTIPALLQELRDQLVEFLFLQQLPKLSSEVLVRQMAMAVLTPRKESWEPLIHQINDHLTSESSPSNHLSSLQALRSILEEPSSTTTTHSSDDMLGISTELRQKLLQHDSLQNLPAKSSSTRSSALVSYGEDDGSSVGRGMQMVPKFLRDRWSWERVLPPSMQQLLDRLRQHASNYLDLLHRSKESSSSSSSSNTSQVIQWRKTQLAMSLVSLLLAWRHRGVLRRWSKTVSLVMLAPVTELIEALAPPSSPTAEKSRS
jgi:hypothetical protein